MIYELFYILCIEKEYVIGKVVKYLQVISNLCGWYCLYLL
jgi:hypothetical protein